MIAATVLDVSKGLIYEMVARGELAGRRLVRFFGIPA
jgi:hypothetical protein